MTSFGVTNPEYVPIIKFNALRRPPPKKQDVERFYVFKIDEREPKIDYFSPVATSCSLSSTFYSVREVNMSCHAREDYS